MSCDNYEIPKGIPKCTEGPIENRIIKEHYFEEQQLIKLIEESKKGVPGKIDKINVIYKKLQNEKCSI